MCGAIDFSGFERPCVAGNVGKVACLIPVIFYSLSDENVYANNYDNDEGVKYIPESGRFSFNFISLTT